MPKIPALPPMSTAAADDMIPVEDASTGNTKYISLTVLKEWLQTVAGWVTTAMIGDSQINKSKIDWASGQIWWEELGRTTLTGNSTTITLNSLPARKYLRLIIKVIPTGGSAGVQLRLNNDSGNNYGRKYTIDFGGMTSSGGDPQLTLSNIPSVNPVYAQIDMINDQSREKIMIATGIDIGATGPTNTPSGRQTLAKWSNTTAQVTRVDVVQTSGTGSYAAGSELIVLGHD